MSDQQAQEHLESANITLPSGLCGTIKRMKIKEMNKMTARSTVRRGNILEVLFKAVWLETTELGVYKQAPLKFHATEAGDPIIDWLKVLQGDRNVLLMEIRKLVRGTGFDFDHVCRLCKNIIKWHVDLDELETYPLSDEAIEAIKSGTLELERTLPYSGDVVKFKLLQGIDQNALARASTSDPDEQFTVSLLQRLSYVPGGTNQKERKEYVENMDPTDAEFLQQEWTDADCDVRTSIQIECPHCFKMQDVSMPLDEDFLFRKSPSRKKRRGK